MTEAIILGAGILLGGLGIAYGIQVRAERREREQLRRFQAAMRAASRRPRLRRYEED
jgi:hypothetical protein